MIICNIHIYVCSFLFSLIWLADRTMGFTVPFYTYVSLDFVDACPPYYPSTFPIFPFLTLKKSIK